MNTQKSTQSTGTKIIGKMKPHKQARYVAPHLTSKPFANLRTLIAAKKHAEKVVSFT